MGGMFTVFKVHDDIPRFATAEEYGKSVRLPGDLGWYKHPPGTVAESIVKPANADSISAPVKKAVYTCPMHPEIRRDKPGTCPICGMKLVPVPGN